MASNVVKDLLDNKRGNLLLPYGLLPPISNKGSFIFTSQRQDSTMAFITPVVEHWLKQEMIQWVHHEGSNYFNKTFLPVRNESNYFNKIFSSVTQE